MTEIEFCKAQCSDFSLAQEIWVKEYIAKKAFIGVGRAFGCLAIMPLVKEDGRYYVVDTEARLRPASTASMVKYQQES
jgi:hypothetical protein